ncbi:MAG: DinB family protein [Dehalococcoidia bacterium]
MATASFEDQLQGLREEIEEARRDLVRVIEGVPADAFGLAPRGEWSIERILRHVVQSEQLYASVISMLRRKSAEMAPKLPDGFESGAEVVRALAESRRMIVAALDGVTEDEFYEMRQVGLNDESVKSTLENLAMHDHEHASQIEKTVAEVGSA